MSPFDLEQGFTADIEPPDEVVVAFFRAFLPDFYFVNTPISRMRRHLQLIRELSQTPLILDFHQATGADFTELTLCASDDAVPGLLSKVAGTLAAQKINIHTAWIHTLRDPHRMENANRIVLDTLILSHLQRGRPRPLSGQIQVAIREALTAVLSGQNSAPPPLSRVLRRVNPLVIEELSAQPRVDGTCQITLRAADTDAILFRIARVLAILELDIAHAQINTFEQSVADVFWVSRSGGEKIEAKDIPFLLDLVRQSLENENFATENPTSR